MEVCTGNRGACASHIDVLSRRRGGHSSSNGGGPYTSLYLIVWPVHAVSTLWRFFISTRHFLYAMRTQTSLADRCTDS